MNAVNMNNNIQFNPYSASSNMKAVNVETPKSDKVAAESNASVNEYGDEFVRSSIIKTEDGAVYSKPKNSDDDTARVPAEEELPKIDSLVGYTSAQVQRFYYEGRISRHDYDVKMEQRAELLRSEGAIANLDESKAVVSTAEDANRAGLREAVVNDDAKAETVRAEVNKAEVNKAEVNKAEVNKADAKKAGEIARQETAGRDKVYEDTKDMRREIISKEMKDAKILNEKMSAIDNEKRSNEEFEIIESGNDAAATFKLVQNLNNLGSGVEGGTWNIA
jgi:hypothetical protein